ncbi:MAG: hypothetical protein K8R21_13980 [Leptospira sp.]|nr:hypothetical protein [Leptospira sp.]
MKKIVSVFTFLYALSGAGSLFPEQVVTTKKDDVDAFYGLRVGGVVSPSYGYRVRDSNAGVSNTNQDDRTGFSTPWTLLMISKEWKDTGITTEFWGELVRSSSISNGTKVDNGTKENPYTLGVRRANIQKSFETSDLKHNLIFGIQELPFVYTQWKGYWKWRYIDRSPTESLGFANAPADIGLSYLMTAGIFNMHLMMSNGEGYRDIQNASSSGYDANARFSFEGEVKENTKIGFHLFYRKGNAFGAAGSDCREGKTSCLPSDNNPSTRLVRDVRALQSDTIGAEFNIVAEEYLNIGLGAIARRQFRGFVYDSLSQGGAVKFDRDVYGKAAYFWIAGGTSLFQLIYRGEIGTGANGKMDAVQQTVKEPYNNFESPLVGIRNPALTGSPDPLFASKAHFVRHSVMLEYIYSSRVRFALGLVDLISYDAKGIQNKNYIDFTGESRTQKDYLAQQTGGSNAGIVQYADRNRQIFIRTTVEF